MSTVGFIGLGTMGGGMARRLVGAGHDVRGWNRSPDAIDEFVADGGGRAASAGDALAADVSFSMLANDEAVEGVFTGEAIRSAAGRTHVVMASISPAMAERMSQRFADAGATYVAAPVLGRPTLAAEGQLNVMAAGPAEAVDAVEPYLSAMGKRVWRLGERPSVANAVKAAVNYNIIHAMQAMGETIAMTERLGVPASQFVELLTNTLFGGVVYTTYGGIIADERYTPPGFHIELGRKDLGLAEEVAEAGKVTLATMPALKQVFERALAAPELKDADWSAIAEVSRRDLL